MCFINKLFTLLLFRDREGIKKKQPKHAFTASLAKGFSSNIYFNRFYYTFPN